MIQRKRHLLLSCHFSGKADQNFYTKAIFREQVFAGDLGLCSKRAMGEGKAQLFGDVSEDFSWTSRCTCLGRLMIPSPMQRLRRFILSKLK